MAISKKQFAQRTYSISNAELADDPTRATGPQKLVLEAAYGIYVAEAKKNSEKCEREKNNLRKEIETLKVNLESQRGETEIERTRIAAIGYFAKRGLIGFGELATKPFIEYFPTNKNHIPVTIEVAPSEIPEANRNSNKGNNKNERELDIKEELPTGWRFPLALVSRFFERLSPLSTAILFALTISAGAAYGKFNSYVASQRLASEQTQHERTKSEIANYEKRLRELEEVELKYKSLLPESEGLRRDIGKLSDEKARLDETIANMSREHQENMKEKLEEYEASIAAYRDKEKGAAATEAAKQAEKILQLNQEIGELKGENNYLGERVKKLETDYETTTAEEKAAQLDAVNANKEITDLRRSLRESNSEKREISNLLSQLTEALYSVERHFGLNDISSVEVRRACYRVHYASISDRFSSKAAEYKLPLDLTLDRYASVDQYPNRWLRQCP